MAEIPGTQAVYSTLLKMQTDMQGLFGDMSDRIKTVVLVSGTGPNGTIPDDAVLDMRIEIGQIVDDTFTSTLPGRRGRHAFGDDGVTPLAPYPKLINSLVAGMVRALVEPHAAYMRRQMPQELQTRLTSMVVPVRHQDGDFSLRPPVGPSGTSPGVSGVSAARRAFLERNARLRIFKPGLLDDYEPLHTWVDPQGYRLSDRLWDVSQRVRMKIDREVARALQDGMSAQDLATRLEQYVKPSRRTVRTTKPYGPRYGAFSFDAMRLARTEITRAAAAAQKAAAIANPYVDRLDWRLSASHPKIDVCDGLADGGPYPVETAPIPVVDSHPQCLCHEVSLTSATPAQITAELREALQEAETLYLQPVLTPLQTESFIARLLGDAFSAAIKSLGQAA